MIYKDIKLSRKQFYVYLDYPFITTDLNAYRITTSEKNAASIAVTAKRADGSTASCIDASKNGCVLPQDIYAVEGELKLFISISDENGSIVTENQVIAYVNKGFDSQQSAGNQNTSSLAVTAYNTANEAKTAVAEAVELAEKSLSDIKAAINDKADKSTTLKGYGITDAYTKTETDDAVTNKVDKINGFGLASIIYDANHCVISVQRDDEEYSRDVDVYSKGYLDGWLEGKVDKPSIYTTSSEHISFEFSEYYNWEMRADEARTISFTFGNGRYEYDYTSGLSFDSGQTPTAIDYTNSGILNWVGTDCVTSNGLSIFQPSPNTHYDIVFYFNGTQFIGLVNGYVPATGNEAV